MLEFYHNCPKRVNSKARHYRNHRELCDGLFTRTGSRGAGCGFGARCVEGKTPGVVADVPEARLKPRAVDRRKLHEVRCMAGDRCGIRFAAIPRSSPHPSTLTVKPTTSTLKPGEMPSGTSISTLSPYAPS